MENYIVGVGAAPLANHPLLHLLFWEVVKIVMMALVVNWAWGMTLTSGHLKKLILKTILKQ